MSFRKTFRDIEIGRHFALLGKNGGVKIYKKLHVWHGDSSTFFGINVNDKADMVCLRMEAKVIPAYVNESKSVPKPVEMPTGDRFNAMDIGFWSTSFDIAVHKHAA